MAQHEGLTREWVERAVKQNTPVLYLHHNDPFMPCTAEWFMDRSELWKCQDHTKVSKTIKQTEMCTLTSSQSFQTRRLVLSLARLSERLV